MDAMSGCFPAHKSLTCRTRRGDVLKSSVSDAPQLRPGHVTVIVTVVSFARDSRPFSSLSSIQVLMARPSAQYTS